MNSVNNTDTQLHGWRKIDPTDDEPRRFWECSVCDKNIGYKASKRSHRASRYCQAALEAGGTISEPTEEELASSRRNPPRAPRTTAVAAPNLSTPENRHSSMIVAITEFERLRDTKDEMVRLYIAKLDADIKTAEDHAKVVAKEYHGWNAVNNADGLSKLIPKSVVRNKNRTASRSLEDYLKVKRFMNTTNLMEVIDEDTEDYDEDIEYSDYEDTEDESEVVEEFDPFRTN